MYRLSILESCKLAAEIPRKEEEMKRTMIQRQVGALSEDLREISEALEREEADAERVAKENKERGEGSPSLPYLATPFAQIKQSLEFIEERLRSTISALGVATTSSPRDP